MLLLSCLIEKDITTQSGQENCPRSTEILRENGIWIQAVGLHSSMAFTPILVYAPWGLILVFLLPICYTFKWPRGHENNLWVFPRHNLYMNLVHQMLWYSGVFWSKLSGLGCLNKNSYGWKKREKKDQVLSSDTFVGNQAFILPWAML